MAPNTETHVDYCLGLDLGQSHEFCALAVIERRTWLDPQNAEPTTYALRLLKRWPMGTKYGEIADEVVTLVNQPPLQYSMLAIDQTGVGNAVVDLFRHADIAALVRSVLVTAGHATASGFGGAWQVPKEELTSILQVLLQARRLKISSRLEHARTLQTELQNYRLKVTAAIDVADESWREHEHDDLVLATALACWQRRWRVGSARGLDTSPTRFRLSTSSPGIGACAWAARPMKHIAVFSGEVEHVRP